MWQRKSCPKLLIKTPNVYERYPLVCDGDPRMHVVLCSRCKGSGYYEVSRNQDGAWIERPGVPAHNVL